MNSESLELKPKTSDSLINVAIGLLMFHISKIMLILIDGAAQIGDIGRAISRTEDQITIFISVFLFVFGFRLIIRQFIKRYRQNETEILPIRKSGYVRFIGVLHLLLGILCFLLYSQTFSSNTDIEISLFGMGFSIIFIGAFLVSESNKKIWSCLDDKGFFSFVWIYLLIVNLMLIMRLFIYFTFLFK